MLEDNIYMKNIQKPWIKIKENIDLEDYHMLNQLQERCIGADQTALKLELDYKLSISTTESKGSGIKHANEFMYFDGDKIIGYIGLASFGGEGAPMEANGMVHPEYRSQGVFKTLSNLAMEEWKRRSTKSMLLLCDRESEAGQKLIAAMGLPLEHSEYEMYLKQEGSEKPYVNTSGITFRKATNADAYEVARQNNIYFNDEFKDFQNDAENNLAISAEGEEDLLKEGMILPEEEEKKGMTIYIAEKDHQIIGKAHIELSSDVGGIYGLGVLPEHRGKGFGRAILMMAVEKLKEANAREIKLQVVTENSNALNLYKSCGFVETSIMDYYEIKR